MLRFAMQVFRRLPSARDRTGRPRPGRVHPCRAVAREGGRPWSRSRQQPWPAPYCASDDDELVARRHLGLGFRNGKKLPSGAHSLREPIRFVSAGFLEPDAVDVEEAVATAPCEADGAVAPEAPAPQAASAVDAEAEAEPEPLMSAPRNAFEALGDAGTDDESDDESDDASEEESEEEGEEEEGEADGLDDLSYEDLQKILLMDLGSTNGASSGEDDESDDDDDNESDVESEEEAEEAAEAEAPPASLLPVAGASSDESPSLRDLLEAFAAEPCAVELTLRRPTAKGGIAEVAWLADHFDCECTSERRGGAKLLVIRKDGFDDDGDGHALAFTPTTRLTKKQRRQLKRGHTTTPKHLRKQLRQAQWERAAEAPAGGRGGGAAAGAAAAGAAAAAAAAARLPVRARHLKALDADNKGFRLSSMGWAGGALGTAPGSISSPSPSACAKGAAVSARERGGSLSTQL